MSLNIIKIKKKEVTMFVDRRAPSSLADIVNQIRPGDRLRIMGAPAMGKTAMAKSIAESVARKENSNVIYWSACETTLELETDFKGHVDKNLNYYCVGSRNSVSLYKLVTPYVQNYIVVDGYHLFEPDVINNLLSSMSILSEESSLSFIYSSVPREYTKEYEQLIKPNLSISIKESSYAFEREILYSDEIGEQKVKIFFDPNQRRFQDVDPIPF